MSRTTRILGASFLLALGLRLGALYYVVNVELRSPLSISPDAIEYDLLARALLYAGDWTSAYFAARPPLVPLLMAGIYAVFGESQIAVAVTNALLGAATAALAVRFAAQLSDDGRVLATAGLLVAIDPASIISNVNLQAETAANFFLALTALWLALLLRRPRVRDALLAGLWLGLASLARPTTIYLFVLAVPMFALLLARWWRLYLPFAAISLLVLVGWSLRNQAVIGAFTYSTVSDFNMLFYRAVSVERWATGSSDDLIRRSYAVEIERRLGQEVDPAEVDSGFFWRNFSDSDGRRVAVMRAMALETFRKYPFWYFALIPPGIFRMYAYTAYYGNPFLPELAFNVCMYGLAAVGVYACWQRRAWHALAITLTIIGYVTIATIASQTTGMDTRMRTSTTVSLALLAANGVTWLWDRRPTAEPA